MSTTASDPRTNGRHRVEVRLIQVHPIQPDARNSDRSRHFTLHDQRSSVILGRASKNRLLVPAQSNLWIESPIITKEHARFIRGPSIQQPLLIRDLNSTHGTHVAGTRIHCDFAVTDGDVVQFGERITNGPLHFEPPTFLVEYTVHPVSAPPTPVASSPESANMKPSVYSPARSIDSAASSSSVILPPSKGRFAHTSTFAAPDTSASEDDSAQSELVEETDYPDTDEENHDNDTTFQSQKSGRDWVFRYHRHPRSSGRTPSSLNVEHGHATEDESSEDDFPSAENDDEDSAAGQNSSDEEFDAQVRGEGPEAERKGALEDDAASDGFRASLPPTQPSPPREGHSAMFDFESDGRAESDFDKDEEILRLEAPSLHTSLRSICRVSRSPSPSRRAAPSKHSMSIQNVIIIPDSPELASGSLSVQAHHGGSPRDPIVLDGGAKPDAAIEPSVSSYRPRSLELQSLEGYERQPSPSDAAMAKSQTHVPSDWIHPENERSSCLLDEGFPASSAESPFPRSIYKDGPFQRPEDTRSAPTSRLLSDTSRLHPAKSDHRLAIQELINQPTASTPPRKRDAVEAGLDDEEEEKHTQSFGGAQASVPSAVLSVTQARPMLEVEQMKRLLALQQQDFDFNDADRDDFEFDADGEDLDMDFDPTIDRAEIIEQQREAAGSADRLANSYAAPNTTDRVSRDISVSETAIKLKAVTEKNRQILHSRKLVAKQGGPAESGYSRAGSDHEESEGGFKDMREAASPTYQPASPTYTPVVSTPDPSLDCQDSNKQLASDVLESKQGTNGMVVTATRAAPATETHSLSSDARPHKRAKIESAIQPQSRPRFKYFMSKAIPFVAGAAAMGATIVAGAGMLISTMHEDLRQEALLDLGL